jgi:hypothetical protein
MGKEDAPPFSLEGELSAIHDFAQKAEKDRSPVGIFMEEAEKRASSATEAASIAEELQQRQVDRRIADWGVQRASECVHCCANNDKQFGFVLIAW